MGKVTITRIGKSECRTLREVVEAELAGPLADLGLKAEAGNATYDHGGNSVDFKLTIQLADFDKGKQSLIDYGHYKGLRAEDHNGEYELDGKRYRIKGINIKASKYPLEVERISDGASYRHDVRCINIYIAQKANREAAAS